MNKENMQKAIDYLEANYDDINERFNMRFFRKQGDEYYTICNSVGCLVGHLTALDAGNINQNYKTNKGRIRFEDWSYNFFDLSCDDWEFMFFSSWAESPATNTLQQGINRMKYMLKHEQPPELWNFQEIFN